MEVAGGALADGEHGLVHVVGLRAVLRVLLFEARLRRVSSRPAWGLLVWCSSHLWRTASSELTTIVQLLYCWPASCTSRQVSLGGMSGELLSHPPSSRSSFSSLGGGELVIRPITGVGEFECTSPEPRLED